MAVCAFSKERAIGGSVPLAPAGKGGRDEGISPGGTSMDSSHVTLPHPQPLSLVERRADLCRGGSTELLQQCCWLARLQMFCFCLLGFSCLTCLAAEPGMVFVPGGEFLRGRSYDWADTRLAWYPNPLKDDTPVRKVNVNPFYMDMAEATNERYRAFTKATRRKVPYHWFKGEIPKSKEQHPVVNVSWDDAVAFCAWEGKRLPTEAEWERASRGLVEGRMYPWGDSNPTAKLAVYGSDGGPSAVCSKERNYFGLCDMIGNVWEWTADWYDRNYYEVAPDRDPPGPAQGIYRTLRGGSWFDQPTLFLTCSYRSWARPSERSPTIGFRCVRAVTPLKVDHRASLSPKTRLR